MKKSPCKLNLLHCRQKPQPLCEIGTKKGIGEIRKMRPQANNAQYNTQGWDVGGGVKWEDSGREGVGGSFVPTYIWAGWNGMTIHILFNSIKMGLLFTAIQIWGTAETRRCDADAVRLQVITWNPPLTLCASYLPLPPPPTSSAPCSQSRLLSLPSLILHMVYRCAAHVCTLFSSTVNPWESYGSQVY